MSTPTYVSYEAVLERVASGLHVSAANLPAAWTSICAQATKDAAAEIKRIFVLKGYTPQQLAASDDARVWNEMLGAFFAFVRGTALASYDLKAVEYLDCRKAMQEAAALVINDTAVAPSSNGEIGGVSSGVLDAVDGALDPNSTLDPPAWGLGARWPW